MKETRLLMGMPVTVEIADAIAPAISVVGVQALSEALESIFRYFESVDARFSTYRHDSEISRINRGELALASASDDMQTIFALAEQTRQETDGYFDISRNGAFDPSGIVKGWAIWNAAELLRQNGFPNFYVDAGGDIEVAGKNAQGEDWRIGIRNPFDLTQIVKVLSIGRGGVATSGSYVRGSHIYNPKRAGPLVTSVVSLTVIGPNVYDADRFATAAFAMGHAGILFIESLEGFEGYMIDESRRATFTRGFERYVSRDGFH